MSDVDPNLRDVLGERAAGVRVVAGLAERAIERDRSNRRRELGVAALAAGLVLAVAVPVGWASMGSGGNRPLPAGPTLSTRMPTSAPTSTPGQPTTPPRRSVTTSTTPTSIPTLRPTGAADAAQLAPATGAPTTATDAGYVADGVFHRGTTTIQLPQDLRTPSFVARLGDGLLVSGPQGWTVVRRDGRKGPVITASQQSPHVAADLQHVLLNDPGGTLIYADSTGKTLATLAPRSTDTGYYAAGLVGTTAYAARPDTGTSIAWDVATGRVTPVKGELSAVNAITSTGIAYQKADARPDGSNSCSALVDLASGRDLWRMCAPLRFLGFSDDGAYLLATGHVDGLSPWRFPSLVVIRASDGAIVLQGDPAKADPANGGVGAHLGGDERLTLQVGSGQSGTLQSCGLDGSCAVVGKAQQLPTDPATPGPYVLSTN